MRRLFEDVLYISAHVCGTMQDVRGLGQNTQQACNQYLCMTAIQDARRGKEKEEDGWLVQGWAGILLRTYILQHLVTLIDDEMADGLQIERPLLCQLQS